MTRRQQADSGALEVLELLASGAPNERLEQLLRERRAERRNGDTSPLRTARLGLAVLNRLTRRQQSEARMAALLSSARDVVAADLDDTLGVVAGRARLLFGFDAALIGITEPESGAQVIRAADGHTCPDTLGLSLPPGTGLHAAVGGAPIWTSDYLADDRFVHAAHVDAVICAENLHAVLAIPLVAGRARLGTLFGAFRHERSFNADEIAAMIALGELTAAAIERSGRASAARPQSSTPDPPRRPETDGDLIAAVARCFEAALAEDAAGFAREGGRLLGGVLTLVDTDGTVLPSGSASSADGDDAVGADGAWVAPVRAMGDVLGTLRLVPDGPTPPCRQLLDLVAHAAATLLLGRRAPVRSGADEHDRLVADLLATPPHSPHALERRLAAAGLDPAEPLMVLVIRPISASADSKRFEACADAYAHRLGGLSAQHEGTVVLLIPGDDPGAAARHLHAELTRATSEPATVGAAGPATGPGAIASARHEAVRCLEALAALSDNGGCATAQDLGFIGLMLSERRDTEGFIEGTLGPLLAYDRSSPGALSETLSAYFAAGNSPTHAAKELHVHPNTIARRLERVGMLLGADWQSPARALEIQVALRLMQIRRRVDAYS